MLAVVLDRMRESGLLTPDSVPHCNTFIRLDNVLVNVFDDLGHYYYLRIAEAYDLEREFRIAQAVADSVGRFVPRPLAFFRDGSISCIVLEGIEFRIVRPADLHRAGANSRLGRELLAYLQHATAALSSAGRSADVDWLLRSLEDRYDSTEQESLWRRVLSATDCAHLSSQPSQRQHGDFVPNNFGMRRQGLVVFDWEDFGRIDLPGFDLAVLLGAVVDFDALELRDMRDALLRGPHVAGVPWFAEACRVAGLDLTSLLRTLPFYLLLFMWLKDRYSPAIRLKVNQAIEGLL